MAIPISQTITAAGTYVFALDYYVNPFSVTYDVQVPGGTTVSYMVNTTTDAINPVPGVGYGVSVAPNPVWEAVVSGGTTAASYGTITGPVRALQIVVASISGGPIKINIIQPWSIN